MLEPGFYLFGVADLENLNSAGNLQAISPDGTKIAAVWRERPIHLFSLADGKLLRRFEGSDRATSLAFSPDGKLLTGNMQDGRICIWETTTGKQTQHFTPPVDEPGQNGPPAVLALRFSVNGKSLAASAWMRHEASDFLTWELATGHPRSPVKGERRTGYAMGHHDTDNKTLALITAPDGKHIAVAAQRCIRIVDFLTGKEVRRFGGRDVVGQSAVFSPDGKYLVAGLDNGGIRFWNAATGAVLHDVPAHAATVSSLAFADEGKTLVSGSLDGTAIAWDMVHLLKKPAADMANLEPLWKALGQTDGEKCAEAMQAFADRPKESVAFFRDRLSPAPAADPKRLRQCLTELQSNQFAVRQRANNELEKLADRLVPLSKRSCGPISPSSHAVHRSDPAKAGTAICRPRYPPHHPRHRSSGAHRQYGSPCAARSPRGWRPRSPPHRRCPRGGGSDEEKKIRSHLRVFVMEFALIANRKRRDLMTDVGFSMCLNEFIYVE